jgi:hypothetical protein
VSARFTGLAWDEPDGKRFLHLGLEDRYAGADNNTLRYKGHPESNVSDNCVDSGNLVADHACHVGNGFIDQCLENGKYSFHVQLMKCPASHKPLPGKSGGTSWPFKEARR